MSTVLRSVSSVVKLIISAVVKLCALRFFFAPSAVKNALISHVNWQLFKLIICQEFLNEGLYYKRIINVYKNEILSKKLKKGQKVTKNNNLPPFYYRITPH
ncbi:hypothetical protein SAMN04488024_108122 [Pedobacter soli]|uniref:Uncharacterized protein n=1 Tax=Pedobacter soli TaxID=390242 RepID=A0A1G6Y3M0_9SPHI|nr:hypothetical protein SAMN04488024_108122 [Pedobacter soli]